MAFDGHQRTFANSLFPTYQNQAIANVGSENNGSVSQVSLKEQDTCYVPWSHNGLDDPYGLISCAQSSTQSRKNTDHTDCDGETDLQGLVSNILDEADSHDSYSEGSLPTCNPIWSPKTLREDLLQYFQSDTKTPHNPNCPPNYMPCEALGKANGWSTDKSTEELRQQSNDLFTNQQWLFNLPKGSRASHIGCPQKLPPGLQVPNLGNTYPTQTQQNIYNSTSVDETRGNTQRLNNFSGPSDVFRPQSPCFYPSYEDHYIQSNTKPISNEQYVPQDMNQLVSSFQSFMAGEHDGLWHGDFPNMHRERVGMHHEERIGEQWKITSPAVSTRSALAVQTQKEIVEGFGTVLMERNGVVRSKNVRCDAFKDVPGFSPPNSEYFQQPKLFSGSSSIPNQYQNKMTMHRKNTSLPVNMRQNQYSKHHLQQSQMQGKINHQMQKEKKRMHMSGFQGDSRSTRQVTNCNTRGSAKKQPWPQHFGQFRNMLSQRFDGESCMFTAKNTELHSPHSTVQYPVHDPRRHSSMSSSNFNYPGSYGSCFPGMDKGDIMSSSEYAAFSSLVNDTKTSRGEGTYHGMNSTMTTLMMMNEAPVMQLHFYLDECYDQWRYLEMERKKTEVILAKTYPGKKTAAVTNTFLPKTPPNPTRVDHLIVNQMREQAKVASLLERTEGLGIFLHANIYTALKRHHMAICITQARCTEETANGSQYQQQKAYFTEYRDTLLLVGALKDLTAATRRLRTALWCALQMALPKPVERQDAHVNKEDAGTASSPSSFEGYYFYI